MNKIKMKGRVVYFDKPDDCNGTKTLFTKDCEINHAFMVPVVMDFDIHDADKVVGNAQVSRDELGLVCDVTIVKPELIDILPELNNEIPIGGFYTRLKDRWKNGVRVIESATLNCIGLTLGLINEDYKLVLVEEDINETKNA